MSEIIDPRTGEIIGGWSRTTGHEIELRAWLATIDMSDDDPNLWSIKGRLLSDDERRRLREAQDEDLEASSVVSKANKIIRISELRDGLWRRYDLP